MPRASKAKRQAPQLAKTIPPGFIKYLDPVEVERPPSGESWAHEIKWDGYRAQAHLSAGRATVYTRKGARDTFHRIAPLLDAVRGTALNTPAGKLLSDYMLLLERNLPSLTLADAARLESTVPAMLGACLAPSVDRAASARHPIDLTLMERVRQAVCEYLRSPALGPNTLCREAATSRSQLYRLLKSEGGVFHYIQRRRPRKALPSCAMCRTVSRSTALPRLCVSPMPPISVVRSGGSSVRESQRCKGSSS